MALKEPGGITQEIRSVTVDLSPEHSSPAARPATIDMNRITFIDTPGHYMFRQMRGRVVCSSDLALIIVSSDDPSDVPQTREVIQYCDRFQIPIIFAFSKIDKLDDSVLYELTKQNLLYLCQKMFSDEKVISKSFTDEINNAIPISNITGENIHKVTPHTHTHTHKTQTCIHTYIHTYISIYMYL